MWVICTRVRLVSMIVVNFLGIVQLIYLWSKAVLIILLKIKQEIRDYERFHSEYLGLEVMCDAP